MHTVTPSFLDITTFVSQQNFLSSIQLLSGMETQNELGRWSKERLDRVGRLVLDLYRIVSNLNQEFEAEGKKFTPDGVLVGHLDEVLAAYIFDLVLFPSSSKCHDAKTRTGDRLVQVKLTGGTRGVALRGEPEHLVVLQFVGEQFSLVYNGEGGPVWQMFKGKPIPSNGQYGISLTKLRELDSLATISYPSCGPFHSSNVNDAG